jgi:hypothetical protein
MALLDKEVEVVLQGKNIKYYENLGYTIPKIKGKWGITVPRGSTIIVKTEDLTEGSRVRVNVKCDNCGKISNIQWCDYKKCLHDGFYYCLQCALKLFANENTRKTQLKNSKSFEQWCIEHNRQDVLDRWDYELNKYKPNEICYCSSLKFYFKCPYNIHQSEIKRIQAFVLGNDGTLNCKACNSFAQWGIDNICDDFLEKYWDYDKNKEIDPWYIPSQWNKKVWIKCQEKDYHGSYNVKCNDFVGNNARCPYCNKNSGKVHPEDSLGKLLENNNLLSIWSDKNNKSPYEFAPKSSQKVWWKCPNGLHNDFCRNISSSNSCGYRCPECQSSKGEAEISNILSLKNIAYIPQKEFGGLIGTGGGNLSYDFYLPEPYNLLIEFQGEQHERYIPGLYKLKKDFEKQLEHDRRKREYAKVHNINLLEIWYYDFDRIEEILEKELSKYAYNK